MKDERYQCDESRQGTDEEEIHSRLRKVGQVGRILEGRCVGHQHFGVLLVRYRNIRHNNIIGRKPIGECLVATRAV